MLQPYIYCGRFGPRAAEADDVIEVKYLWLLMGTYDGSDERADVLVLQTSDLLFFKLSALHSYTQQHKSDITLDLRDT